MADGVHALRKWRGGVREAREVSQSNSSKFSADFRPPRGRLSYHLSMTKLFGNLTTSTASKRFLLLLRHYGPRQTLSVCAAMADDQHIRSFDRWYGVRTSGHVELSETSFDPLRLKDATSYGPVNAWGLRKLLRILDLPASGAFVDLGSGLGRACLIAAEYGFERVTGVELAPELCKVARDNVAKCRIPRAGKPPINIIEGDVLHYCDYSVDDIFFIYRAFSLDFLLTVLAKLEARAAALKKPLTLIYTERLGWPQSECVSAIAKDGAFHKSYAGTIWGQAFFAYRCGEWL